MRGNKGKDTKPEVTLRRLLHVEGYRFRLHRRDLPGRPDIVFPSRRTAIEVRGCFWHQHPGCRHATTPSTRQGYWVPKLARNVERDHVNAGRLQALGWRLAVVWECQLKADPQAEVRRLQELLGPAGQGSCKVQAPKPPPPQPTD